MADVIKKHHKQIYPLEQKLSIFRPFVNICECMMTFSEFFLVEFPCSFVNICILTVSVVNCLGSAS
jgi:hypothetical protein